MAIPYSDTFDNLDNWTIWNYSGATSSIESGRLKQSGSASGAKTQADFTETLPLDTECDVSVEIEFSISAPGDYARLCTGYLHYIGIYNIGGTLKIREQRGSSAYTEATETVPAGPVKVKLRRKADNKTQAYYDIGSGWTALGPELQFYASDIYTWVETKGSGSPFVAYYDNFQAGEPVSNDLYCPDSEVDFIGPAATAGKGFGVPDCADIPDFFALTEWNTLACWDTADVPNFVAVSDPVTRILAPDCSDVPRFFATTGRAASFRVPDSTSIPRFRGSTGKAASFSAPDCADVPRHYVLVNGFATILLPDSEVIPIFSVWGPRYVVVMNALHHGVTEYENFPFESLEEFEGRYYGLTGSGWYILGGDTDDGAEIAASFATGDMNYNNGEEMRLLDAKLTARSAEQVKLTVAYDDETGYDYYEGGDPSGEVKSIRFVPGKGAKGRAVRLTIENTNGGSLEAKQLVMTMADLSRGGR